MYTYLCWLCCTTEWATTLEKEKREKAEILLPLIPFPLCTFNPHSFVSHTQISVDKLIQSGTQRNEKTLVCKTLVRCCYLIRSGELLCSLKSLHCVDLSIFELFIELN